MNGHRKEAGGNNSIVLKLSQEDVRGTDEVTDAITKLQQNGVNCIFFTTKKELLNFNNNHNHTADLLKNKRMRRGRAEQANLNDLLDYEPDIKSINASSLTIQHNNHNCLVSPLQLQTTEKRKRGRRKGVKNKKRNPNAVRNRKRKKVNGLKKFFEETDPDIPSLQKAEPPSSDLGDDQIHHDYLTNGFFTPPPRLSPQCSDDELCRTRLSLPCQRLEFGKMEDGDGTKPGSLLSGSQIAELTSTVGTGSSEFDDEATMQIVGQTLDDMITKIQLTESTCLGESDQLVADNSHLSNADQCLVTAESSNPNRNTTEGGTGKEKKPTAEHCNLSDDTGLSGTPAYNLRHSTPDSSFYSLVTNNVRYNLENYLDGKIDLSAKKLKSVKGKKRLKKKHSKNGYLLNHGDNYPHDPELSYKLNLTTQILLKLNQRRFARPKPKTDKRKSMLAALDLVSKRPVRTGKAAKTEEVKQEQSEPEEERSLFSGEWTLENKYVCGICRHQETDFWDMVTHKGEEHSGVLVTHVELPVNQDVPRTLIRETAQTSSVVAVGRNNVDSKAAIPGCTKCSAKFSTIPELHRHIFECSGNTDWLKEQSATKKATKTKRRRRQGFKRRLSNNTPKKNAYGNASTTASSSTKPDTPAKRKGVVGSGSTTNLYKCKFCIRHFKTEGWLKNHQATHTLLVSIPFTKLPKRTPALFALPEISSVATRRGTSSSTWSLRRYPTRAVVAAQ